MTYDDFEDDDYDNYGVSPSPLAASPSLAQYMYNRQDTGGQTLMDLAGPTDIQRGNGVEACIEELYQSYENIDKFHFEQIQAIATESGGDVTKAKAKLDELYLAPGSVQSANGDQEMVFGLDDDAQEKTVEAGGAGGVTLAMESPAGASGPSTADPLAAWLNSPARGPVENTDGMKGERSVGPTKGKGPKDAPKGKGAADTPTRSNPATEKSPLRNEHSPRRSKSPAALESKASAPSVGRKMVRQRPESKTKKILAELEAKRQSETKQPLNLVVCGHVDAGKSTLMGHLLYLLGYVDKKQMHKFRSESEKLGKGSFAFAWVLDSQEDERNHGVTIDVSVNYFETERKRITLLDAPGHRDFVPRMITGAAQADVGILVINSTQGEFESGFENNGQTKEHAILARSLGITQLVVAVNKMDTVDWSQDRFDDVVKRLGKFLKATGYREKNITYIPCSGFLGKNVIRMDEPLAKWYTGPTLVQAIDSLHSPQRDHAKFFRLSISDIFKDLATGVTVAGKIESGVVATGDNLLLVPSNQVCTVKSIRYQSNPVQYAVAGWNAELGISGIDIASIRVGDFLCDPERPIRPASKFTVRIATFALDCPIVKGHQVVLHSHNVDEPATVTRLISLMDKKSASVTTRKPRMVGELETALVRIQTERPICLELYRDFKQLGRFMLRDEGRTIAAGMVEAIHIAPKASE